MYHGIILDLAFIDSRFPERFHVFAKRRSATEAWWLIGVEVSDSGIESVIKEIQTNLREGQPFYVHFYNDSELIVIFKEKVFKVAPHRTTWAAVIEFGKSLGIPEVQLDFWPNRFQDETHYFSSGDFV